MTIISDSANLEHVGYDHQWKRGLGDTEEQGAPSPPIAPATMVAHRLGQWRLYGHTQQERFHHESG